MGPHHQSPGGTHSSGPGTPVPCIPGAPSKSQRMDIKSCTTRTQGQGARDTGCGLLNPATYRAPLLRTQYKLCGCVSVPGIAIIGKHVAHSKSARTLGTGAGRPEPESWPWGHSPGRSANPGAPTLPVTLRPAMAAV